MADENQNAAAQADQSTPSGQEQGSESQESQSQAQEGESTESKATSDNQGTEGEQSSSDGETGDQSGHEAKPTRVERRVDQLLSRLKDKGQSQQHPGQGRQQPVLTKEEIESGRIDPNVLVQRIQSTVQSEVAKGIQLDRINQQYESSVKDHQVDLESVKDLDPDLEAEAVAEYEAINYQINPLTGQRVFIPAVKFSEVVAKITSRAEKLATKKAEKMIEENGQYISKVSSSQAVPSSGNVSGSKSVKDDTDDFAAFEKAHSS